MPGSRGDYDEAIRQLAEYLNLDDDALRVAEGWSILPAGIQRHVKLLIDDYIASQHPLLREMYAAARPRDQQRMNRIIEDVQARLRGQGDEGG